MKNIDFKKILYTLSGLSLAAVAVFLIFSSAKSNEIRRCEAVIINIKDDARQLLVKKTDVESWATQNNSEPLVGKTINEINLEGLERRVESSGMIKECEAYVDLKGNLILDVEVFKPVARILGGTTFPDRYMDESGRFFPISQNYTPTVMLVSGSYFNDRKGLESTKNQDLRNFINQITQDNFWNAQITRIDVSRNKEILMVPMLGNNLVEFGKPINVNTKLEKLMVYYKKILPQKQWSNFSKVSVKYDGQIVCN